MLSSREKILPKSRNNPSPRPNQECHVSAHGYEASWLEALAFVFRAEDFNPENPDLNKAVGVAMHEATHPADQPILDERTLAPHIVRSATVGN